MMNPRPIFCRSSIAATIAVKDFPRPILSENKAPRNMDSANRLRRSLPVFCHHCRLESSAGTGATGRLGAQEHLETPLRQLLGIASHLEMSIFMKYVELGNMIRFGIQKLDLNLVGNVTLWKWPLENGVLCARETGETDHLMRTFKLASFFNRIIPLWVDGYF